MSLSISSVIGVISGTLGIIDFLANLFPPNDVLSSSTDITSRFNIAVGLDGAGPGSRPLRGGGGDMPDVRLWDNFGRFLGMTLSDGRRCSAGETTCRIDVEQVDGRQPTYVLLSGNEDAICVAYVTHTWPDGQKVAWSGGWGAACGQSWYYSGIYVNGHQHNCSWIDGRGYIETTGIQIHFPEFNVEKDGDVDKPISYYCDHAPVLDFRREPNPHSVKYWDHAMRRAIESSSLSSVSSFPSSSTGMTTTEPENPSKPAYRPRNLRARFATAAGLLIKSHRLESPARALCESATSVGPSFLSYADRLYCDMLTKTLYPICGDEGRSGEACFSDQENKVEAGKEEVMARDLARTNFTKIILWN